MRVVAPDAAEAHEEQALLAEEARARAVTKVSFRQRGDGTTDLYARLADAMASRARAYLRLTAPILTRQRR